MKLNLVVSTLLLVGCAAVPADPAGTTERVRESRTLRAGIIAEGSETGNSENGGLLSLVEKSTGSQTITVSGSTETLIPLVESGQLDIVIGRLAADTPWADRVTIIPYRANLSERDKERVPVAIARNGENAWISLISKHSSELKGESR